MSDGQTNDMLISRPPAKYIAAAGVTLVGVVLAVAAGLLLGPGGGGSSLPTFVGRFHPLIVHLPIGFLVLSAAIDLLSRSSRYAGVGRALPPMLALSAVSAVLAVTTGWLLSQDGGYDAWTVGWHRWLGVAVAVTAALTWLASHARRRFPGVATRALYNALLAGVIVLLGATGHFGGTLTHGESYLTEHLPRLPFVSRWYAVDAAAPVVLHEVVIYPTLIAPVLQERCATCHGAAKSEGGFRLDTAEGLRKGGGGGPVLSPGQAARSELIRRIWLPPSHEDAMPPRGHRPPTVAEASLLRWWIEQGASFDQKLTDAEITPEIEPAIEATVGPIDLSAPAIVAVRVQPADTGAVDALKALGLTVAPLAGDTSLLQVQSANVAASFGDEQLRALLPLARQVTWLDLGGTRVTDDGVALLSKLPHLSRLHLDRTAVTDAGLAHLVALEYLEYLNLYGTSITDAGMTRLTTLARLRTLYVWQTAVTAAGAEALESALPRVKVNLGVSERRTSPAPTPVQ